MNVFLSCKRKLDIGHPAHLIPGTITDLRIRTTFLWLKYVDGGQC